MEDIITEDGKIWFVDSDFVTDEATEDLTVNIQNDVTKEVASIWLNEDNVRCLIKQLTYWLDD